MLQRFEIIKKSVYWILIGLILMLVGIYLFFSNIRLSTEFTGGVEIKLDKNISESSIKKDLGNLIDNAGFEDNSYKVSFGEKDGYSTVSIKLPVGNDEQMSDISDDIKSMLVDKNYVESQKEILSVSIIGPSIGEYMKDTAVKALVIGLVLMIIYILFAFSSLREFIAPQLLALITVFTMIFDVGVSAGAYGIMMMFNEVVQVNTIFIIAILTIMGYSINDTIIIFDRIRENFQQKETSLKEGKTTVGEVFETSLWQTMRRSIGTSVSTLLVVIAMFIFGTGIIKLFAFTLGVGIIAGTYSSIFLAAPIAYILTAKNVIKEENK